MNVGNIEYNLSKIPNSFIVLEIHITSRAFVSILFASVVVLVIFQIFCNNLPDPASAFEVNLLKLNF